MTTQNLPDWMQTREMEKAMKTLMQFSEKENDYHEYQARQNFIREQRTIKKELEAEREGRLAALAEKNELLAARTRDQAEIARLKALLEQQGKSH